jgi:hypothetical protein
LFDFFILNKQKEKSLLLIHGFYANAGFWLRYLTFLKEYRLVLLNINYLSFLESEFPEIELKMFIMNVIRDEKIHGIIGHSLGSLVANICFGDLNFKLINICPVFSARREEGTSFARYLEQVLNVTAIDVEMNLIKVDSLISSYQNKINYKGLSFVPTKDIFFHYNDDMKNIVLFDGDHFDIQGVFNILLRYLKYFA